MSKKDQQLLSEAYSVQLLKESFPHLTLQQVLNRYDRYNLSEQAWVDEFSTRVIEELFGGLGAVAGSAGRSIGGGLAGLAKKGMDKVSQGAKSLKQGASNAAQQVGQNVKNVYDTAEDKSKLNQGAKKAEVAAKQLAALVQDAQQRGYVTFSGDPMEMPLGDLVDELILAAKGSSSIAKSAQNKGILKGAGQAFKQGFNQ